MSRVPFTTAVASPTYQRSPTRCTMGWPRSARKPSRSACTSRTGVAKTAGPRGSQPSPSQSGAVSAVPGASFSGSLDGHIRAYASDSGKIVWDFDTVREYETVNGVPGRGGSLDGPGPVIAGGMMFVNSGYTVDGGMAGNVVLAFSVDGK